MADLLQETVSRLWRALIHYVQQARARRDWSTVRRMRPAPGEGPGIIRPAKRMARGLPNFYFRTVA
jgi:hypothetical protein